jgi:hypothetical protein
MRLLPVLLLFALPAAAMQPGLNRPGGDFRDFDLDQPDPALCEQACRDDPACRAYTFVEPGVQGELARCWLKDSVPEAQADACCTSGVVPRGGLLLEAETDRPGNDYRDFELGDDPQACARACEDDPDCRAFSFVRPGVQGPEARCWLKDAVPAPQPAACCVSGAKPD